MHFITFYKLKLLFNFIYISWLENTSQYRDFGGSIFTGLSALYVWERHSYYCELLLIMWMMLLAKTETMITSYYSPATAVLSLYTLSCLTCKEKKKLFWSENLSIALWNWTSCFENIVTPITLSWVLSPARCYIVPFLSLVHHHSIVCKKFYQVVPLIKLTKHPITH